MVVVFPFNDPHPPSSPSEPHHQITKSRSGNKLEVSLPGISRDSMKVDVSGSKVVVTGKKNGTTVYRLSVKLSGAENGVEVRKESGRVTVKVKQR